MIESKARRVYRRYMDELDGADVKELAIHRRVSKLNYTRRCAEASAVQALMKQGIDPERTASEFDAAYYRGLF